MFDRIMSRTLWFLGGAVLFAVANHAVAGEVKPAPPVDWSAIASAPMTWNLSDQNKIIITVHPDGTVKLGEGVTLDEASKVFWDEMQREGMKLACPKEGHSR